MCASDFIFDYGFKGSGREIGSLACIYYLPLHHYIDLYEG